MLQLMMNFGMNNMEYHEIKTYGDLPEFGKYVIVIGTDKNMYNMESYHICCIDDGEDGFEFKTSGYFIWITENGTKISDVKYWCEIPTFIEPKIYKRIKIINKIRKKYGR